MNPKYEVGQTVYIVSNNKNIQKGTVLKYFGGLYTIKLLYGLSGRGSATRLKEYRIFATEKEAKENLK